MLPFTEAVISLICTTKLTFGPRRTPYGEGTFCLMVDGMR